MPAVQPATILTTEQLLGLPDRNMQAPGSFRILLIKYPAGGYAVTVSNPVELRSLEVDTSFPLQLLIAVRNTLVGIHGLVMGQVEGTVLVDFGAAKPLEE